MRRRGLASFIGAAAMLLIAGCGGGDDPKTSTPATTATPSQPPSPSAGQLPPAFLKCMRDRGYAIASPDEIHSAPPEVLQACFGELHGTK